MWFRCMGSIMLASTTLGCGQYGVSGPDDLGLAQKLTPTLQIDLPISDSTPLSAEVRRNQELSKWLVRSDYQCNKYLAQLQILGAASNTWRSFKYLAQLQILGAASNTWRSFKYLAQLPRGIRDSRLATDVVATVLSGLATILAPVGTKTALSGAATITLGVGGISSPSCLRSRPARLSAPQSKPFASAPA
jgi:hypothetical protein